MGNYGNWDLFSLMLNHTPRILYLLFTSHEFINQSNKRMYRHFLVNSAYLMWLDYVLCRARKNIQIMLIVLMTFDLL